MIRIYINIKQQHQHRNDNSVTSGESINF